MCHVLVIEDDFLIADYIIQLVEAAGATSISQAMTQQEAIEQARVRRPKIILSDVQLIEGTGPLAVRAIRAELGAIPVIFVTGTPEACKPYEAPAVVLTKPICEREIAHHFRQLAEV